MTPRETVASAVVRVLKVVVALLLAVTGVTGCGLFGHDSGPSKDEQIQKLIDENPTFVVFLRYDATAAQRKDIESALRSLPGFTGLTYADHDAAYQRMKQVYSADPSDMPIIEPDALPESYEIRMTDVAAVRKIRDSQSAVNGLPGVQKLIFPCMTVPECRQRFSPRPTTAPPS